MAVEWQRRGSCIIFKGDIQRIGWTVKRHLPHEAAAAAATSDLKNRMCRNDKPFELIATGWGSSTADNLTGTGRMYELIPPDTFKLTTDIFVWKPANCSQKGTGDHIAFSGGLQETVCCKVNMEGVTWFQVFTSSLIHSPDDGTAIHFHIDCSNCNTHVSKACRWKEAITKSTPLLPYSRTFVMHVHFYATVGSEWQGQRKPVKYWFSTYLWRDNHVYCTIIIT